MINFILAVAGLTLIVTKSKIFKKPRTYFTLLYEKKKKTKMAFAYSFVDSIFNCYMCFSLWGGLLLYPFKDIEIILLVLDGVIVTTLIIDLWQFLCRK